MPPNSPDGARLGIAHLNVLLKVDIIANVKPHIPILLGLLGKRSLILELLILYFDD